MKNILVTGSNGQLGNEIRKNSVDFSQFKFFFTDIDELDITNEKAINELVTQQNIDCIINCAAYTAVDKAESNEELCDLLNHKAPEYLARAIGKRNGTMIQISTDYVFDGSSCIPYKETMQPNPKSVYGRTKLAGEQAVMAICSNTVIIRTAWLCSPFGKNFVKTMVNLGRSKEELSVVADQIGTPTFATDLAHTILSILTKVPVTGIYHFSSEGVTSWYDFTKTIHRMAGITTCNVKPVHTEEYPTPAARPHYSVLDKTKIKETYNLDIPWWEDSLEVCIKELTNI